MFKSGQIVDKEKGVKEVIKKETVQPEIKEEMVDKVDKKEEQVEKPELAKKPLLERIKENLGFEYEDEEQIIEDLKLKTKVKEYEQEIEQYKTYKDKYGELESKFGTLAEKSSWKRFFDTEEDYKKHLIRKKIGSQASIEALESVISSDIDQLSDEEVLAYAEMLDVPDYRGGKKAALDAVKEDYKLDDEDVTESERNRLINKMKKAARDARNELRKIKSIELPEDNFEPESVTNSKKQQERMEQLEKGWEKPVDEVMQKLNDFPLEVMTDGKERVDLGGFNIDEDFKGEAKTMLKDYLVKNGKDLTKENLAEGIDFIVSVYKNRNFDRIISSVYNKAYSEAIEKEAKKRDNPRPSNSEYAGKKKSDHDIEAILKKFEEGAVTNNSMFNFR